MKRYKIEFSEDELIILSDWLNRFNRKQDEKFEDQAEQRVLWDLDCALEKLNEFVLSDSYAIRLQEAYARIRDKTE